MSVIEELENKHVLLDTCFIIKAFESSVTDYFDNLFFVLKNSNCIPVINEFIEFEFMKGCQTASHIKNKKAFLNEFSKMTLPIQDKLLMEDAINISNIYRNKGMKKDVGLVDCGNSAFLKKFENNLLLLTMNHSDYPLIVHDRIYIHNIDVGHNILTMAFYSFNNEKFNNNLNDFQKTI